MQFVAFYTEFEYINEFVIVEHPEDYPSHAEYVDQENVWKPK